MTELTAFRTEDDLLKLTGLATRDELWDVGFNLDDWDIGFQTDRPLFREPTPDELNDPHNDIEFYDDIIECVGWNDDLAWLVSRMMAYCVGPSCVEYDGKYYTLVHHS